MSYKNAVYLLPEELLEQIQQYIDGCVIYIPKKEENKKHWGDHTDTKRFLSDRNTRILSEFEKGAKIQELAEKYFLTEKSIRRILKQKKF